MTTQSIALRSAIASLAALTAAPLSAQAPTPPTAEIVACYRAKTDEGRPEGSGIVYRVNTAGVEAQQGCLSSRDIQFSWTTRHTALTGLDADDHKQYLLASGARALTGNLSAGGMFKITGLAAATAAGDAVRFEQAVKATDPAGGDLGGMYPNPAVAKLQGRAVSSTLPKDGDVLTFNAKTNTWEPKAPRNGDNGDNGDNGSDLRALPGLQRLAQEQAREIESLRAELAALRAEIAQRKP
jgi:hypothetical protein